LIEQARLEAALAWAEARYHDCDVCAARCHVDRHAGELGLCGLGVAGRVYKEYLHLGEERCLVPSHTVFLAGCNLRCVFCSDLGPVEHPQRHGTPLAPAGLAARIALRRSQGARNVNFVGGLPDVNVLYVLRTLALCPPDTHVVWNTNLWTTEEAIRQLTGVVGTWLVDHKFGADRCARELARVKGYTERLQRLLPVAAAAGPTIVRHLLMPGHLECCTRPVLEWLARQLPDATVNLMTAYHPFHLAGSPGPLGGPVPAEERAAALAHFAALPFRGGRLLDGVEYPCAP
jgi:putative pyruvate formate lyase activating enzyme